MESTLDVLRRIETRINSELKTVEDQYSTAETGYERTAALWERTGLHIALFHIHVEMDNIAELGKRGGS